MKACSMHTAKAHRKVKSKRYLLKSKITYLLVAFFASVLVSFLVYSMLGPKNTVDSTPKIAVVDQLSVQWPDPTFNQTMLDILNETGLQVD